MKIGNIEAEYLKGDNTGKEVKTDKGTYYYDFWSSEYSSQQLIWKQNDYTFMLETHGTKGNPRVSKGEPFISKADLIRIAESVK